MGSYKRNLTTRVLPRMLRPHFSRVAGRAVDVSPADVRTVVDRRNNLVLNSGLFTNSGGLTTATLQADGSYTVFETGAAGLHYGYAGTNNVSFIAGVVYAFEVRFKAGAHSWIQINAPGGAFPASAWANFNLTTGAVGNVGATATASIVAVGDGSYKCRIVVTATITAAAAGIFVLLTNNTNSATPALSYTGTSGQGVYYFGGQVVLGSTFLDYEQTGADNAAPAYDGYDGLRLEAARTQLLANPGFSGAVSGTPGTTPAGWTRNSAGSGGTRTVAAIDLGNSIQFVTANATDREYLSFTASVTSGVTYTMSCLVYVGKVGTLYHHVMSRNIAAAHTFVVQRDNGVVVSETGPVSVGWHMLEHVVTMNATSTADIRVGASPIAPADRPAGGLDNTILYPQFEAGAFRSSYIFNTTGTISATDQMLYNTGFSGAIAGNPGGQAPTGWAVGFATGSVTAVTAIDKGNSLSLSAAAQRMWWQQTIAIASSATQTFSVEVTAVGGGLTIGQFSYPSSSPVGATYTFKMNGVVKVGGDLLEVGTLECILVNSTTAGNVVWRLGIGTSSNTTGTVTFQKPQCEAAAARGTYIYSFVTGTFATLTRPASYIYNAPLTDLGILSRTNEYTIAVLVKMPYSSAVAQSGGSLFGMGIGSGTVDHIQCTTPSSAGQMTFQVTVNSVAAAITTTGLTWDKDEAVLFALSKGAANGMISRSKSTIGTNTTATAKAAFTSALTGLAIGCRVTNPSSGANFGSYQGVRVWDYALSQAELEAITPASLLSDPARAPRIGIGYGIGI